MSKILQLRRGTTIANDNFTGMAGEITMDTDAKTIRVHDGITLGGFALARADTPTSGFDINGVSDDFWDATMARIWPNAIKYDESDNQTVNNLVYIENIFNLNNVTPLFAQAILICVTSDAGYGVGDTVYSFGVGTRVASAPNIFADENGLHVRQIIGGENIWVSNAATGVPTEITNDNWRIKFRIFYA